MPTHYAQYDPDLANQLLDEMGLDQRDGDGFRLRPDGETLFINFQVSVPEDSWRQIGELITSYWNDVGVKTSYKLIEIGLYRELRDGNQVDMAAWGTDMLDIGEVANGLANMRPHWGARASGHLWRQWMQSDGEDGEEPPQEIKDLWAAGEAFLDSRLRFGRVARIRQGILPLVHGRALSDRHHSASAAAAALQDELEEHAAERHDRAMELDLPPVGHVHARAVVL